MAIDSKIIRIRRGTAADFNVGKTKLVQGEFAVVTDAKEAYFAAENGEAVRLATEKDVSQLEGQILNLDVRSITSIEKTSTDGLVDTYTIEMSDGTSYTYSVTNGDADDEKIQQYIINWLDEHPEATTTVQNGSITEEKLHEELMEKIKRAGSAKMATVHPIGELFETEYVYNSWVHNNVKYDSVNDRIVVLWSASSGHTETDRHIMMAIVNPRTFEPEEIKIVYDNDGAGANVATYGFEILDNGTYMTFLSVYDSALENYGKVVACTSSDYGDTWTFKEVTANNLTSNAAYEFFGLTKLSTGRLLMIEYNTKTFMYSDDDGATWECATTGQRLHEPCFIEHSNGSTVVCYGRKTMYGTSNGAYNGTKQKEPAVWWISTDGGTTWTAKGDSSTITEMTSSNCCASVNDGYVDLYVCSRLPHGDAFGVIYHYYASEDDAINDNWGTPKVVLYPLCATGQDFSYIGCCLDSEKNTHIFYYDSDGAEGETGIYHMIASNNPVAIPVNSDMTNVVSIPYSRKMVDSLISGLYAKLNKKINTLILESGGSVEGGDALDGSMYVTDGLYEMFDFTLESSYDVDTYTYTGLIAKETMKWATEEWGGVPTDTSFNPNGLVGCGILQNDITESVPTDSFTIELSTYLNIYSQGSAAKIIRVSGGTAGMPILYTSGGVNHSYVDTSGSTKWNNILNTTDLDVGFYMLTIVSDGDSLKTYINGKRVCNIVFADITNFASISISAIKPTIGITKDTTNYYNKGFRIYNRPLTAEEVKNNYQYESASY